MFPGSPHQTDVNRERVTSWRPGYTPYSLVGLSGIASGVLPVLSTRDENGQGTSADLQRQPSHEDSAPIFFRTSLHKDFLSVQ